MLPWKNSWCFGPSVERQEKGVRSWESRRAAPVRCGDLRSPANPGRRWTMVGVFSSGSSLHLVWFFRRVGAPGDGLTASISSSIFGDHDHEASDSPSLS